jgi:hypothetical protein
MTWTGANLPLPLYLTRKHKVRFEVHFLYSDPMIIAMAKLENVPTTPPIVFPFSLNWPKLISPKFFSQSIVTA